MIASFDSLPDQSRIWIFSSTALMDDSTRDSLLASALVFLGEWTAHDKALTASAKIEDGVFLVVAVDESSTGASGCSIDKLHRFVKEAELQFSTQLLDRLTVVFPGNPPLFSHASKIKGMVDSGELDADSLVYDTTIADLGQFRRSFRARIHQTWIRRYLQNA